MNFADKLKLYRNDTNLTLEEMAHMLGTTKQVLSRYERGERTPKISTVQEYARRMGVAIEDLIDNNRSLRSGHYRIDYGVTVIPVYNSVPAGIPIEAIDDYEDTEEIPTKWCEGGKEFFGVHVKGDSMYPKYMEGDTIIVRKQETCESGNDCIVYVNGYEATLKQIKIAENGSITLQPFNTNYSPVTYTAKEVAESPILIAGVVVEIRRRVI